MEKRGLVGAILACTTMNSIVRLRLCRALFALTFVLTVVLGPLVGKHSRAAAGDALSILTAKLPVAAVGEAYEAVLQASGGVPPYRWEVSRLSKLPEGLSLGRDGTIRGRPRAEGTTNVLVNVWDSAGTLASAALSITVLPEGLSPGRVRSYLWVLMSEEELSEVLLMRDPTDPDGTPVWAQVRALMVLEEERKEWDWALTQTGAERTVKQVTELVEPLLGLYKFLAGASASWAVPTAGIPGVIGDILKIKKWISTWNAVKDLNRVIEGMQRLPQRNLNEFIWLVADSSVGQPEGVFWANWDSLLSGFPLPGISREDAKNLAYHVYSVLSTDVAAEKRKLADRLQSLAQARQGLRPPVAEFDVSARAQWLAQELGKAGHHVVLHLADSVAFITDSRMPREFQERMLDRILYYEEAVLDVFGASEKRFPLFVVAMDWDARRDVILLMRHGWLPTDEQERERQRRTVEVLSGAGVALRQYTMILFDYDFDYLRQTNRHLEDPVYAIPHEYTHLLAQCTGLGWLDEGLAEYVDSLVCVNAPRTIYPYDFTFEDHLRWRVQRLNQTPEDSLLLWEELETLRHPGAYDIGFLLVRFMLTAPWFELSHFPLYDEPGTPRFEEIFGISLEDFCAAVERAWPAILAGENPIIEDYLVLAQRPLKTILTLQIGSPDLIVERGGQRTTVVLDAAPEIPAGTARTLLPIRPVVEALGGKILWFEDEQRVEI
ncbi:MAG: copper amine oxidase N-terminal domain-containing protein [Acetobacteraceae bacterium]|nr:copper amine oxidase N-terminal domain-containing protein [Acetobacteraceae bacterium]